jgi:hypothetical protein
MTDDGASESLSFAGRTRSARFDLHRVTIASGCELLYVRSDWADAVVVLEEGELELECRGGTRARFRSGAVLVFDALPLRTLRNAGRVPVLLIGVSRRADSDATDESAARSTSDQ